VPHREPRRGRGSRGAGGGAGRAGREKYPLQRLGLRFGRTCCEEGLKEGCAGGDESVPVDWCYLSSTP
jgi:hypothetical protein